MITDTSYLNLTLLLYPHIQGGTCTGAPYLMTLCCYLPLILCDYLIELIEGLS